MVPLAPAATGWSIVIATVPEPAVQEPVYGAVIVHLFAPEEREFYGLERLWSNAAQVVRLV